MDAVAPAFDWRPATAADVPLLAALYRDCALRLGPAVYSPAQVRAWAAFADDAAGFRAYVVDAQTGIATRPGDGRVLGFCGVTPSGAEREVRSLYVTPGRGRQGLGGEMLRRTLATAQADGAARFEAWATPFSRPVFEAAGFVRVQAVQAPFGGTTFERWRMRRG